jgi:hypothetical protein
MGTRVIPAPSRTYIQIPFDSTATACRIRFEIPADKYYNGWMHIAPETDGGFILAGSHYEKGRRRVYSYDTLTEVVDQQDCFAERFGPDGKSIWRKAYILDPGETDFIEAIHPCKAGGFLASANRSDGKGGFTHELLRISKDGALLWQHCCEETGDIYPEETIELDTGSFFAYADAPKLIPAYHPMSAILLRLNDSGRVLSKTNYPYPLENLCYISSQGNADEDPYFEIQTGSEWRGRRELPKQVIVIRRDKTGKRIWNAELSEKSFQDGEVPWLDFHAAADTGKVMLLWTDIDFDREKPDEDGKFEDFRAIKLTRMQPGACWTKSYVLHNYSELYDARKVNGKWRVAGMSVVKVTHLGSGSILHNTSYSEEVGEKLFFIAEFDDEGNVKDVKRFYRGREVKDAWLTDSGIIFNTRNSIFEAEW